MDCPHCDFTLFPDSASDLCCGGGGKKKQSPGKLRSAGVPHGPYRTKPRELRRLWKLTTVRKCFRSAPIRLSLPPSPVSGAKSHLTPSPTSAHSDGLSSEKQLVSLSILLFHLTESTERPQGQRNSQGQCHACVTVGSHLRVRGFFSWFFFFYLFQSGICGVGIGVSQSSSLQATHTPSKT